MEDMLSVMINGMFAAATKNEADTAAKQGDQNNQNSQGGHQYSAETGFKFYHFLLQHGDNETIQDIIKNPEKIDTYIRLLGFE